MDTNRIPKQPIQYKPKITEHTSTEEEMGRTNYILRIKEQETRLNLQEHDDDDDYDDGGGGDDDDDDDDIRRNDIY